MGIMYNTKTFTEFYENYDAFEEAYESVSAFNSVEITPELEKIYYLLYARYGNSPIANFDENQFKYKLFSTIWQFAPTWIKELDIQSKLRGLTEDDLLAGAKTIHNHAFNPSTEPSTAELEEVTYINDQNTTNYKRSQMEAYSQLWSLLSTNATENFLSRFSHLFKKFVGPERAVIYSEEVQ